MDSSTKALLNQPFRAGRTPRYRKAAKSNKGGTTP